MGAIANQLADASEPTLKGKAEFNADGGEFIGVETDKPVQDDWSAIFARFNRSADDFEIVDDTVRESTWQQSKRTENGDRDIINLYSYSARFRRKTKDAITEADVEAAQERLRKFKLPKPNRVGHGTPTVAVLNLADIQMGKSEGGGINATIDRLQDGLENFHAWLNRQIAGGRNITGVAIVNNGDPIENIAGNYATQLHTVQGGLRKQQNLALDVWEMYARDLFPRFEHAWFISVLCNHGEYGRLGSAKNQTSDSDNAGGFLAETLRRVLNGRAEFDHVQWVIPHDEMNVYATLAGVPVGFNHGHKIPGSDATGFEKWLNGQARGDEKAHEARVWVTAHRHNFQSWDLGSTFAFSCPSCDGGSKWLRDMTGRFSRSGTIAFLVGEHDQLGVSDVAFL